MAKVLGNEKTVQLILAPRQLTGFDLPGLFSERRRDYSPCEEFQIGGSLRCDCPSISPDSKLAAGPMCTTNARGATSRNFSGKACSQTWAETVVVSCRRGIVLHPDDGTRPGG